MASEFTKHSKGISLVSQAAEPTGENGDIYYSSALGKFRIYQNGIWQDMVTPASPFTNYISNNKAESDTSGWATYLDSGSRPIDGSGGSPNITWTRTTSSPLSGAASFLFTKDAANRQGQGVSYDINLDVADRGKVFNIRGEYSVASGTFVAGSDTADSDLIFYIYDITNSKLIEPTPFRLFGQSGTLQGSFQPDVSCSQIRFIIHVASASTSAYTVKFDNFFIGREPVINASIASDWTAYTPTFGGFGTPTNVSFYWRRVGANVEIIGGFTTGTVTASQATVSLPSGLVADSLITFSTKIGVVAHAATVAYPYHPLIGGSNTAISFSRSDGTLNPQQAQTGSALFGSSTNTTIHVSIPIQGWSSQTQASNQSQNRDISARYSTAVGQSISNGSTVIVDFGTATYDTAAAVTTGGSWKFTAPEAGRYSVSAMIAYANASFSQGSAPSIYIYKNGSIYCTLGMKQVDATNTARQIVMGSDEVPMIAGDYIDLRTDHSESSARSLTSSANENHVSIKKVQGPVVTLPAEAVVMRANKNSTGSQTSNGGEQDIASWDSKSFDSHNGFNLSTGEYTCPRAGVISIGGDVGFASNSTGLRYAVVQKNGSTELYSTVMSATVGNVSMVSLSGLIQVNAGDLIKLKAFQNSGGNLAYSECRFCINYVK